MKHVFSIAKIAVQELVYEKFFYILVGFAIVGLGMSMLLGQLTYAEKTKLTLDFMLAGIEISMVLFSVFMGVSLFHRELALGSVSMVLSKPISRTSFLLGKYLGQMAVQSVVILGMTCITLAVVSQLESDYSVVAILQASFMIGVEVCVLTALTYLFAVNANALTTSIVTLCMFWLGHFRASSAVHMGTSANNPIWVIAQGVIPDLNVFNMKTLASYAFSVSGMEILWASLYGLCCATLYLLAAALTFARKDILT
jgi:Cu-processing system permease protein